MSFVTTLKVRFYELDPYNHLNHATYVQYFEVARVEMLDRVGMGLSHLGEMGYQLVVTDLTIRYLAPAGQGDELTVLTDVAEVRRASSRWRQRLLRGDAVLAEQEIRVATTTTEGRPTRMPAALVEAFEAYRGG